jgi:cysteine desulfurase / selenocysteine lyase
MNLFDKEFFPTLNNNPELAYFDNAASTQTHRWVLDRMNRYYEYERCNIHRSDFVLSDYVANEVGRARESVANLLGAQPEQIMFTTGATEGLNMVAEWHKLCKTIIVSEGEHNANIVPWLAQGRTQSNNRLVVLPVHPEMGRVEIEDVDRIVNTCEPGSLLCISTVHNATGVEQPWDVMARIAKAAGVKVCLDACQSIVDDVIDVSNTDADYIVFSGHKMFGPVGVGVVFSRQGFSHLEPFKYGGGGVEWVTFEDARYMLGPDKHEVGTQNIAGMLGMGVAAEFLQFAGLEHIVGKYSQARNNFIDSGAHYELMRYGFDPVYPNRAGSNINLNICTGGNIFSYRSTGIAPGDVSALLGQRGVAVRTGFMCAHPLVSKLSNNGLLRISVGPYNTRADCEKLASELNTVLKKLA